MPTSTGQHRDAADRLRAIGAGLAAAGLAARLHESPAETDLTATLRRPGQREIEVVVDEDGYTELRYWASLDVPPAHAVATITGALAAIVPAQRFAALVDVARRPSDGVTSYDGAVTQRAGEGGMPGPQDHVAEQERSPDAARPREPDHPRESRVQPTDLHARLERLPVGHPSSPYRDDGSRKPPPPDLAQYELPLPDERPPEADQPDSDLRTQNSADVGPDGSWRREGRELTPERSRIADQALAKCHNAEGRGMDDRYGSYGLTPAMRRIEAQLDHGHLAEGTERFALKEANRFKEKFARLIERYPGADPNELVNTIHDGVRYTFIFDLNITQRALRSARKDWRTQDTITSRPNQAGLQRNTKESTVDGENHLLALRSRYSSTLRRVGTLSRRLTKRMRRSKTDAPLSRMWKGCALTNAPYLLRSPYRQVP